MLSLEVLSAALPDILARFGARTEVRSGCPNPVSPSWKLLVKFTSPGGLGMVTVWEHSGCCDIDFLAEGSVQVVFWHGEFASDDALLKFVAATLQSFVPPSTSTP